MANKLSAGVARANMTPPSGIAHASWGAQTHERAVGVDFPLVITALALSDGEQTTVTIDLEVVILWSDNDVAMIRKKTAKLTGIPENNIRISYTHTHSGPCVNRSNWFEEGDEMVDPYLNALIHKAAGTAWEAVKNTQPARVVAGAGESKIAVNRRFKRPEDGRIIVGRNPEGPVDHEVGVIRIDTEDGEPLAVVANYACHPIIVGPDNDLITPDYPGVVRRTVEESTGATCLFLQGAAGDVGPIRGVAKNGIEWYKPLGRRLGSEVARVWWGLDPRGRTESYVDTLESGAPLAVYEVTEDQPNRAVTTHSQEIHLPTRELMDPDTAQAKYEEHQEELQRLRDEGADDEAVTAATFQAKRAKQDEKIARQFGHKETHPIELQIVTLSPNVAIIAIPGEPFVETGKQIKEESPYEFTLFSGYSNVSRVAYIPTAQAHDEGGYETRVAPFAPEAADKIVEETIKTLNELRG